MPWTPNEKEIKAVLALDGSARYRYLVKKAADEQQVWSLCHRDGWALAQAEAGCQLLPIWPHSSYAERCADRLWEGFDPKAIPVGAWLDRWIPGMVRDGRLVAAFPTPNDKGTVVEPRRFERDLRRELTHYE